MTADKRPYKAGAPGGRGKPGGPGGQKPDRARKPFSNRDEPRRSSADDQKRPYGKGSRDAGKGPRDAGNNSRDAGKGFRDGGKGSRDAGKGFRDASRPSRPPQADERRVPGPEIPDEVTPRDLHPSARNELKTLSKENADEVARHLAMAARLIDEDPALAHEHALAASRRAGRIAVVRETVAITAYAIGDFALALRELRTYRRISGRDDQIALLVDSERGVGRPDRALEAGRAVERATLPVASRVALAIAMSGARLDRGELELALGELEIPELDPNRAFEWSPALFAARAAVLEDLGRADEAAFWTERADAASAALARTTAEHDEIVVEDGLIEDGLVEDEPDGPNGAETGPTERGDA